METFPISKADVEKHIFEPWLEGAHGWDLEMHEVQEEKREKLVVNDIKSFRHVIDICNCKAPVGPSPNAEVLLTRLDEEKWALVCKQLEYDTECFRVYLQSHQTHVHHVKLKWNQKRREEATQWALQWMQQK